MCGERQFLESNTRALLLSAVLSGLEQACPLCLGCAHRSPRKASPLRGKAHFLLLWRFCSSSVAQSTEWLNWTELNIFLKIGLYHTYWFKTCFLSEKCNEDNKFEIPPWSLGFDPWSLCITQARSGGWSKEEGHDRMKAESSWGWVREEAEKSKE